MVVAKALVREDFETFGPVRRPAVKPISLPGLRSYLLIFGCCLVLFGANATLHGLVAACSARTDALAISIAAEENEGRRVELDIAYLTSYPRIAHEAETRLAMHAPGPGELRYMAFAAPGPGAIAMRAPQEGVGGGLTVTLGGWVRAFGRTAASIH